MEDIIEKFSCNSWLLVHCDQVNSFIDKFNLELIDNEIKWSDADFISLEKESINIENFKFFDANKLTITATIKNYQIIEGKAINFLFKDFCDYFLQKSEFYKFDIDIWIPIMKYQYFSSTGLVRSYEYMISSENGEVEIREFGEKLRFENEGLETIQTENGYDYFYYPLSIMKYLGIEYDDLKFCRNSKCSIYKINNMFLMNAD